MKKRGTISALVDGEQIIFEVLEFSDISFGTKLTSFSASGRSSIFDRFRFGCQTKKGGTTPTSAYNLIGTPIIEHDFHVHFEFTMILATEKSFNLSRIELLSF